MRLKEPYNLILSIFEKNHSKDMEISMENLLKEFYSALLQSYGHRSQKIQALDHYLSRCHNFSQEGTYFLKQNKEVQYETFASIGDIEPFSTPSSKAHNDSSAMFYTFLLSNSNPESTANCQTPLKIVSQTSFTDYSFSKVVLYAIFINFLHVNKQTNAEKDNIDLTLCLNNASMTLKKVKIAMVSAAQSFKISNKKKYTKIRYLYDQLVNYTEKKAIQRQDYIKVIIEEFDDEFIHKTFDNLKSKCNELLYSWSMCSAESLKQSSIREDGQLFEIGRALEYLKVKAVLWREGRAMDLSSDQDLYIMVEEMPNGAFKLKQIISMRSSLEDSFQ